LRRLYRYLALTTLPRFTGALLLVCVVYASIDLVEAGSLTRVPAGQLLGAYPLKFPSIAAQMLPLALLFGVLLALSSLRLHGEWDALRSAGLSPLRLSPGLLAVPLLGVLVGLPLIEWLAPAGLARYQAAVGAAPLDEAGRPRWSVEPDGALTRTGGGDTAPLVIERDENGRAVSFEEDGRSWRRGRGWGIAGDAASSAAAVVVADIPTPAPGQLAGSSLTRFELSRTIHALESSGRDASPWAAQGALRLALIAACLVVPLLGLMIALGWSEGRASRLIALGLLVGAAYWLALATAWNGAVLGVWSVLWVSAGVPVLFGVLALLAGVRVARLR
jgi:lipopolysaccharide export LptBFGC system permease protein LptF